MTRALLMREGIPLAPREPPIGSPPGEGALPPLSSDMFLNFVNPSTLLLLPPREAAETLLAQHRERLALAKQQQQRAVATCPPPHKRLRGPRRAGTSSGTRLVAPVGAGTTGIATDEGLLLALERGLAARQTLHRLRHHVLELPKPNRHGVGLIYGVRMSSVDGHDYRVIYWGELHGATKEEKAIHKRNAQQFRALIRSLVEASPDRCLTVQQLVLDLDINMSKGWVHFTKLSLPGKQDPYSEFLLRRKRDAPQPQQ